MKPWDVINVTNGYAHIWSPIMDENDPELLKSFSARRKLVVELKKIEQKYKGWFSWTLTSRPHVIRLLHKLGAKPYAVTLRSDEEGHEIWFTKESERK